MQKSARQTWEESLEGEKRTRCVDSMIDIVFVRPGQMAMLTVAFMADEPREDSHMQRHGGQEKFPRYLGIVHMERAAGRTMHGFFQDRRVGGLQQAFRGEIVVMADLDAPGDMRWSQKQECLQPFVMISAGFDLLIPQQRFEDASVVDILKNGHINPRVMSSRSHRLPVVPLPAGVKGKSDNILVDCATK